VVFSWFILNLLSVLVLASQQCVEADIRRKEALPAKRRRLDLAPSRSCVTPPHLAHGPGGWRDSSSALALLICRGAPGEESEAGKRRAEKNRWSESGSGIGMMDEGRVAAWMEGRMVFRHQAEL